MLTGKTILVTGARGFLGTNLCRRLLECGALVHGTSRAQCRAEHPRIRWWRGDFPDQASVNKLFEEVRPEVVVHLAGQVTAVSSMDLVEPTFQSLLASTIHVLTAATTSGCRRVLLTGSLTEPAGPDGIPGSPYAAAKWAGTGYARMFHKLYGTPVVNLRPFMTYGPAQHPEKLVPYVIRSLLQGKAPQLSSGRWRADWIFVDDLIDGFMLAMTQPNIEGCTFDLGSGSLTAIRDIVMKLADIIGATVAPAFGAVPDRPAEEVRVADTSYSKKILGWQPTVSLDEGLKKTVAWYRDHLNS